MMGSSAQNWRDAYYATALDLGLSVSVELENRQRVQSPLARHWSHISVLDVVTPSSSFNSSPTLVQAVGPLDDSIVSPSTIMSDFSLGWQPPLLDSNNTSPTTIMTEASLPPSSMSARSGVQEVSCHLDDCGEVFRGSSCATNLVRHKRTAKKHQKIAKFNCFLPNCKRMFSRSDNRNDHVYRAHPDYEIPGLQPKLGVKRRRQSEDEVESKNVPDTSDDGTSWLSLDLAND